MGLDLEVLATHFRERGGEFLPTARLRFDRDDRLFSQLSPQATPPLVRSLPEGLRVGIYGDEGLTFHHRDRHGHPFTFTTPGDLRKLRIPPEDFAPWNQAIMAFLLTLPPDFRIVLHWC